MDWIKDEKLRLSRGYSLDEEDLTSDFSKAPIEQEMPRRVTGKANTASTKKLTDAEWGNLFYERLDQDLIEVPAEFYEETIFFEDPDQLNLIFSDLEE